MAVQVLGSSEISNSVAVSPRISFSHYLNQEEEEEEEQHASSHQIQTPSSSSNDFDFHFKPADEVFSEGIILPSKSKEVLRSGLGLPPNPGVVLPIGSHSSSSSSSNLKHFWRIGRSASVNSCGNRGGRGILKSLDFLSRSKSTGSLTKQEEQKRALRKNTVNVNNNSSNQRRGSGKSCRQQRGGEGVRVMPVLNITPLCISMPTVSSTGFFRPLLCGGGKDMKTK